MDTGALRPTEPTAAPKASCVTVSDTSRRARLAAPGHDWRLSDARLRVPSDPAVVAKQTFTGVRTYGSHRAWVSARVRGLVTAARGVLGFGFTLRHDVGVAIGCSGRSVLTVEIVALAAVGWRA